MKKNSPYQKTKHHIYPSSRQFMGVTGVCKVERLQHELYHRLFGNLTPEEILEHLNSTFWANMFDLTIKCK